MAQVQPRVLAAARSSTRHTPSITRRTRRERGRPARRTWSRLHSGHMSIPVRLPHEVPRERIGRVHVSGPAKCVARKLIGQQEQGQHTLGRLHPGVEVTLRREPVRFDPSVTKEPIECRILGKPAVGVRAALGVCGRGARAAAGHLISDRYPAVGARTPCTGAALGNRAAGTVRPTPFGRRLMAGNHRVDSATGRGLRPCARAPSQGFACLPPRPRPRHTITRSS